MRKKLIEVALPLDAINAASAREKSIRHGHPSTLHLWWARRPLAAARAVIFAQMVDDPSEYVDVLLSDPVKKRQAQQRLKKRRPGSGLTEPAGRTDRLALADMAAELERERLFRILEELVKWENTTNETVLERARTEIWQSWRRACAQHADQPKLFDRETLPAFHDPFAGGGALPLEAQRLGLEAHASDLNPVAVLINKAMIEVPPKFAGRPSVNPESHGEQTVVARTWRGAQGLAEDVRHYGRWMRDEAENQIGHLYPPVEITPEMVRERPDMQPYEGRKLTVIAWLWARTVKSPNPAFADVDVPLASTFMLSTKKGKEAYVEPVIEDRGYRFTVRVGKPPDALTQAGTKLGRGANFRCVMSEAPLTGEYIKAEGQAGRMGACLLSVVAEGDRGRVYLPPTVAHTTTAWSAVPTWQPEGNVPPRLTGGTCVPYGMSTWGKLFTSRQLVALTTFSDLVQEATARIRRDAAAAGLPDDGRPLRDGGAGATAYAEAVSLYLSFAVDRVVDRHTSIATWDSSPSKLQLRNTFARQAIPMTWDFGEGNPFCTSSGTWLPSVEWVAKAIASLPADPAGEASQADASAQHVSRCRVVSTDPPYYDNIGYADLSDFFYVWLRRSMKPVFPELFATLAVPKAEELVATPYRHGGRDGAEAFFLRGMTEALRRLAEQPHEGFPVTIYYAFKQSERKGDAGVASTGWETFLDAAIQSGFTITGTWPMRTELGNRITGAGTNALASSIILVCRRRLADAQPATRREFLTALRSELPPALRLLQSGNVAPVDLAQAAIGPGMGVYTRYVRSESPRWRCQSASLRQGDRPMQQSASSRGPRNGVPLTHRTTPVERLPLAIRGTAPRRTRCGATYRSARGDEGEPLRSADSDTGAAGGVEARILGCEHRVPARTLGPSGGQAREGLSGVNSQSVDLVYADPPFKATRTTTRNGSKPSAGVQGHRNTERRRSSLGAARRRFTNRRSTRVDRRCGSEQGRSMTSPTIGPPFPLATRPCTCSQPRNPW